MFDQNHDAKTDGLSEKAQKLVELLGHEGKTGEILKEYPELAEALDEYIEWRDKKHRDIDKKVEKPNAPHAIAEVIKKLPK